MPAVTIVTATYFRKNYGARRVNPGRTHQRADPGAVEGLYPALSIPGRAAASQAAAGALAGPPASAASGRPEPRSSGLDAELRRCSHGLLQVPGGRLRREGVDQCGLQGWPQGSGGREGGQPRSHPLVMKLQLFIKR